jgi:hypothetical protein
MPQRDSKGVCFKVEVRFEFPDAGFAWIASSRAQLEALARRSSRAPKS